MIKQLGTIGFFIKVNDQNSTRTKILEVFSSSALSSSLFSASLNSSNRIATSNSSSIFLNGIAQGTSSVIMNQWQHIAFTFDPKLETDSSNNFLVRFGNTGSCDFNIQNLYMLDTSLGAQDIRNIHITFTGASAAISTGESASGSIRLSDKDESRHTSSVTNTIYQPYSDQLRFLSDVRLVTEDSLSSYIGNPAVKLTGDLKYFDGVESVVPDRVLSISDNAVYQLNVNGGVTLITTSNGDYINVIDGLEYIDTVWLKTSGSFTKVPTLEKIVYFLDQS